MNPWIDTLFSNEALRRLVEQIHTLPSLPAIYRELRDELRSPDPSIDKAARIIAKDMGMVTKILQVVNAPFFGLSTKISNPVQAVAFLGLDRLKALVLSMQVFSQFRGTRLAFFSLEVLWRHSLATGGHARAIAKEEKAQPQVIDDAFTAGLLHDVGILVLITNLPEKYTDALALMQDRGIAEWEAEYEALGATHGEVGGYLLANWGLEGPIVEAVSYHHDPMRSVSQPFSPLAAVHVANAVDEEQHESDLGGIPTPLDTAYLAACGLADRPRTWRAVRRGAVVLS
ncbi:MAG: HDOD domain-containing protein [Nitrospirota bacterium]